MISITSGSLTSESTCCYLRFLLSISISSKNSLIETFNVLTLHSKEMIIAEISLPILGVVWTTTSKLMSSLYAVYTLHFNHFSIRIDLSNCFQVKSSSAFSSKIMNPFSLLSSLISSGFVMLKEVWDLLNFMILELSYPISFAAISLHFSNS